MQGSQRATAEITDVPREGPAGRERSRSWKDCHGPSRGLSDCNTSLAANLQRQPQDFEKAAQEFVQKLEPQIFTALTSKLQRITAERVNHAFTKAKVTASGMDNWQADELKLMSLKMCARVADMYNTIEAGCKWPTGTRKARAAYFAKDESQAADPMQYRVLLIMSHVYKRFASVRLQDISEWIST